MRKGSTKLRELAEAKVKADKDMKRTGGNLRNLQNAKPKQVGTSSAKNTYVITSDSKRNLLTHYQFRL